MKTILVTGSTGYIGSRLVTALSQEEHYRVIGAVEDDSGITDRYQCGDYLETVSNRELLNGTISGIDCVVNCAFARSNDPGVLADALDFTTRLALSLQKIGVGSLINISSQGVYKRMPDGELQTEESAIEPIDLYSLAKYSAERILLASRCAGSITNVRLASINMRQRFLFAFVRKVVAGEPIVLTAPNQNAALLDVSDAVSGLQALLRLPEQERKPVYNLGTGQQMTILDYARVVESVMKDYGYSPKLIVADDAAVSSNSGMDCSRIMRETGWEPRITVRNMVDIYLQELQNGAGKL